VTAGAEKSTAGSNAGGATGQSSSTYSTPAQMSISALMRMDVQAMANVLAIPGDPVQLNTGPPVTRWVRYTANVAGSAGTYTINASVIATLDFTAYGAASARFSTYRFLAVRAWCSSVTSASAAPFLTVGELNSDVTITDTGEMGGRSARVGMAMPLSMRITPYAPSNTTTLCQVAYPQYCYLTIDMLFQGTG
jgi:hypothetical protein